MGDTASTSIANLYPMGPDAAPIVEFSRIRTGNSGGSAGYTEPFSMTKSGLDLTISNLIFQVGNRLYETAGTKAVTVSASGYLWAKIDTSGATYVVDSVVAGTALDEFDNDTATESGKYHFKPLYKFTVSDNSVSVALDLRKSQQALLV